MALLSPYSRKDQHAATASQFVFITVYFNKSFSVFVLYSFIELIFSLHLHYISAEYKSLLLIKEAGSDC